MAHQRIAQRVDLVPPSGIRRFFDIAATMPDVISLGIGEPDFVTPAAIRAAGARSLDEGRTAYTSNSGLLEPRLALADHLERLYGVRYDPESELSKLSDAKSMKWPVRVSDDLFTVFVAAQRVSEQSGGAFDITVGPLTKLWR